MHCGVMVTGYNQADWDRLMAEDYSRPPATPDYLHMEQTLQMGELVEPLGFDSIWATEHYGSAYSLGIPLEESHAYFYDVVNAIRAADGAERFTFDGQVFKIPPTTIRPQARHKGDVTTRIKAAFTTKKSAQLAAENGLGQMFVANDDIESMTAGVNQFNEIRAEMGLPPDQPTTLLWMYCAEKSSDAEAGWEYYRNQVTAAQHHYFEWNNPGFQGVKGYEEYLEKQSADVAFADQTLDNQRRTQPIGTPDEIIDRIKTVQRAIDLETLVVHVFYGGMPREKAERSLRLFAEKVLPEVHAIDTRLDRSAA
jgi:alkanesulfonate monooxygenase SsuD/methylene tetrahydromethanopterin reductase-like flavin-dependent oxidoreductase (luciferase family)